MADEETVEVKGNYNICAILFSVDSLMFQLKVCVTSSAKLSLVMYVIYVP